MLAENSSRVFCYFAADYKPEVTYAPKLLEAAAAASRHVGSQNWAIGEGYATFLRDPKAKRYVVANPSRFASVVLGYENWAAFLPTVQRSADAFFQTLGIRQLQRLGFRFTASLPLGDMPFHDMLDLYRTAFIGEGANLDGLLGAAPADAQMHLWGAYGAYKTQMTIAPQTADQANKSALATLMNHHAHFVDDPISDDSLRQILAGFDRDALLIDVDFYGNDVRVDEIPGFLDTTVPGADRICEAVVRKLTARA